LKEIGTGIERLVDLIDIEVVYRRHRAVGGRGLRRADSAEHKYADETHERRSHH
jgi:hypothetical protein